MPRIFMRAAFRHAGAGLPLRPENPLIVVGLEHIILHVGLCKAVARLAPRTAVAMRVDLTDRINRVVYERTVRFQRSTGNDTRVQFDSTWGTYKISLSVPKYGCNGVDFIDILQDHDRNMNTTLVDGPANVTAPVLVAGSLPVSFAHVQPTLVAFPATLRCNGAVGDPQTDGIDNQLEQDAYYASMRTPALYHQPIAVTLAVRFAAASGGFHYIRVPFRFSSGYTWPSVGELNIDDSIIDWAAQKTEDVLLCPRYYGTSVG
jgi:hypothetical protein